MRADVSESAFWECTDPVQSMQHNQLRDSQFSTVHLEDNTLVRRTRGVKACNYTFTQVSVHVLKELCSLHEIILKYMSYL